MRTREEQITFLLLNYIALEGARDHFVSPSPDASSFADIRKEIELAPPQMWLKSTGDYVPDPAISAGLDDFEYSWNSLKRVRNNLFHANKAKKPDTLERLDFLLNWSLAFIEKIYETNGDLAQKAKEIKGVLDIKSC